MKANKPTTFLALALRRANHNPKPNGFPLFIIIQKPMYTTQVTALIFSRLKEEPGRDVLYPLSYSH